MKKNSMARIFSITYNPPEFDGEIKLDSIREDTCIYFLYDKEEIIYIGQTKFIQERIRAHRKNKKFDTAKYFYPPKDEDEDVRELEMELINWHNPKYNKMFD